MRPNLLAASFVVFLSAVLNLGTIRKKEDPILKTQADPISIKQKIEEEKEGIKAAPIPSFKFYEKGRFFTEPPGAPAADLEKKTLEAKIPEAGVSIPENLGPDPAVSVTPEETDWFGDVNEEADPFQESQGIDEESGKGQRRPAGRG